MSFIVKNTTKISILDLVCPHHCKKCGAIGEILCPCCKKYIIRQAQKHPELKYYLEPQWLQDNILPFKKIWSCGYRDQVIGQLAQDFKYHSVRASADTLAEILAVVLSKQTNQDFVVVPLPTNSKHIRERGFDHTYKIAQKLSKKQGWKCQKMLQRVANTVQVGASLQDRYWQANEAYSLDHVKVNSKINYLLLDDVWTTGASILAAERLLRQAGAQNVYGVVISVSR